MSQRIKYTSENGFTGVLYGKSSLVILKDNREVLHTGSRKINTREELIKCVDEFPEFYKILCEKRITK